MRNKFEKFQYSFGTTIHTIAVAGNLSVDTEQALAQHGILRLCQLQPLLGNKYSMGIKQLKEVLLTAIQTYTEKKTSTIVNTINVLEQKEESINSTAVFEEKYNFYKIILSIIGVKKSSDINYLIITYDFAQQLRHSLKNRFPGLKEERYDFIESFFLRKSTYPFLFLLDFYLRNPNKAKYGNDKSTLSDAEILCFVEGHGINNMIKKYGHGQYYFTTKCDNKNVQTFSRIAYPIIETIYEPESNIWARYPELRSIRYLTDDSKLWNKLKADEQLDFNLSRLHEIIKNGHYIGTKEKGVFSFDQRLTQIADKCLFLANVLRPAERPLSTRPILDAIEDGVVGDGKKIMIYVFQEVLKVPILESIQEIKQYKKQTPKALYTDINLEREFHNILESHGCPMSKWRLWSVFEKQFWKFESQQFENLTWDLDSYPTLFKVKKDIYGNTDWYYHDGKYIADFVYEKLQEHNGRIKESDLLELVNNFYPFADEETLLTLLRKDVQKRFNKSGNYIRLKVPKPEGDSQKQDKVYRYIYSEYGSILYTVIDNTILFHGKTVCSLIGYKEPSKPLNKFCTHSVRKKCPIKTEKGDIVQRIDAFITIEDIQRICSAYTVYLLLKDKKRQERLQIIYNWIINTYDKLSQIDISQMPEEYLAAIENQGVQICDNPIINKKSQQKFL